MEGLCLLLAALSAAVPGQGAASREAAAATAARARDGTPRFGFPTALAERTGPPSTLAGSVAGNASVAPGSGPILRDEVGCEGHEEHLWDCPAAPEHDCSHKEDAGVVCSEHQEWRLSGGRDGCAGRVEVFFRGTWSTVCDSTWYKLEASVLCRTLGCGEPLRQLSFGHTLPGRMLYQCESQQPLPGLADADPDDRAEEGSPAAGARSPLHMPLFVLCLVLAALLLLTVLAFTATLLRVRKMSAHAVSSLGLAGPVLMTHSAQNPSVPSETSNDYRDMPPSLPKGPVPPVTALPTAKDSDSDYEHYDFSSKPPVALSTFYNSLRRQPGEQLLPLPYCNDGAPPPHAWVCPPPPADGTHRHTAPTTHSYTDYPSTGLSRSWVPVSPADPDPADSSSTSSEDWYENVQGVEPPGDPSPHPGWPAPSCPSGGHTQDPDSSEGSDYDDIQGSAY
ncbi:PREDICTED: T-cell differentiation antigen CD6 [Aptenodytes forsteri]|uniref:T-cell differentiation antigen CD6 n=1 Tax=Aptenodytes forsteri TaxID=9233 RepID=UPI000905637B|nr:PREDICTED: T-cell differentiation antigen CD6 [Aptenodytes forsteri]